MTGFSAQEVRDNRRRLRFEGRLLGEGSSERPGAARWSVVSIYQVRGGGYVLARQGCSTMVHRPDCARAGRAQTSWLALPEDADRRRDWTGCPECRPDLVDWDPQTLVEGTRYTAALAADPEALIALLWDRPPHLPTLTRVAYFLRQAVEQACISDPALAQAWTHHVSG